MGNNQMLAGDPVTGEIRRFMVGPKECEVTGLTWSPDRKHHVRRHPARRISEIDGLSWCGPSFRLSYLAVEEDRVMRIVLALLSLAFASSTALAAPVENHWASETDPAITAAFDAAAALIEAEDFAAALPILRRIALDDPANADIFNLLGFAHRKTGDLDAGARAYERALYLNPDHLGALEYQGELFLSQGVIAAAEANLARLRALCASPCKETDALAAALEARGASSTE